MSSTEQIALLTLVLPLLAALAVSIWAIVDAASYPRSRWEAVGKSKAAWISLIAVFTVLALVVGVVLAIVYLASVRPVLRGPSRVSRGNRWVFPAVLTGIVVVFGVTLILVATSNDDDSNGQGTAALEVSAEVSVDGSALPRYSGSGRDAAVGMAAPTLGSVDFQGDNIEVGGETGAPYALVFLAHWCPNCQAEVPRLVAVERGAQIEGVDVIGVVTGTSESNPNYPPSAWLAREDWPFPVLVDDARGSAANAYGLAAYPFFAFVDADGNVAGRISGEVSEADLRVIFRALAQGETLPLPGVGASTSS